MLEKFRLWLAKFREWWQEDFEQRICLSLLLLGWLLIFSNLAFTLPKMGWITALLYVKFAVFYALFVGINLYLAFSIRLVRHLGYLDPSVRQTAFEKLLAMGQRAIPLFLQVFRLSEMERLLFWNAGAARILAVEGLGRLRAKEAVSVLIDALKDKSPLVRARAAWALGEIGDERAIPALVPLLGDARYFVDYAEARRELGFKFRHKVVLVCDYAAKALEKLGKDDLAKAIRTLLAQGSESSLRFLRERYRNEAIAALMTALESPVAKYVVNAAWALGELGAIEAIPKLKRVVRKFSGEEREVCMKALARLEMISRLPTFPSAGSEISSLPRAVSSQTVGTENLPSPAQPPEASGSKRDRTS